MNSLGALFSSYIRSWKANPGTQVATLVVLTLSFTIILTISTLTMNLERFLVSWGESAQVTVYLEDDLDKSAVASIKQNLSELEGFVAPEFVSKRKAFEEFSSQMAKYAPEILTENNYESILPQSYRLTLGKKADVSILASAAEKIQAWAGVEEVSYGQEWVDRYSAIMNGVREWGWIINATILLSILFIIGNSIRMIVSQRRDEIEILELVGATSSTIRLPFIFEGALSGIIAGSLAIAANTFFVEVQRKLASQVFSFWDLSSRVQNMSLTSIAFFLIGSALIGAVGSYICVKQINTGWAASGRLAK